MSASGLPTRLEAIYDAPVWMTPPERVVLYSTVYGLRPRRALEIGTFRGGSAMIIVAALDDVGAGSLTCVDPNPQIEPEHLRQIEHRATIHEVASPEGLSALAPTPDDRFEFALIDGDHSYEGVVKDTEGVLDVLTDNALILFHDAHYYEVADAIDATLARHADRLIDCGLVSTLQVPQDEIRNGRPVIWGGFRMVRLVAADQPKPASQPLGGVHPARATLAGPAAPTPSRDAHSPARAQQRTEEARGHLEAGDSRAWSLPSRFGVAGAVARAALRRVAQPLTVRQRQIDAELLAAIGELSLTSSPAWTGPAGSGPPPALLPASVIDLPSNYGPFYVHAGDEVMTPYLKEHAVWELAETRFLAATLRPGQTMLDVGANFGYFSVLGAQLVGPHGTVIAVEPEPRNVSLLRANLWRHRAENVVVLPIAAGHQTGYAPLQSCEENRGDHRVGLEHEAPSLLVPAARLDEVLPGRRIDVAKIDTQGMDHYVIAGIDGLLPTSPGLIVLCEFWLTGMEERNVDPGEVLDRYRSLGFTMALLDEHGVQQPASPASVLAAAAAEGSRFVNLVLKR